MSTDDHDDIAASDLTRALMAPASEAELAGEADAMRAFRQATRRRRRRVLAGRAGTGGAVMLVVLSGAAAAAAYTASLPTPLQHVAHGIFHEVGVPSASRHHSSRKHTGDQVAAAGTRSASPRATGPATVSPVPSTHPSSSHPTHVRRHGSATHHQGAQVPAHVAVTVSAHDVGPGTVVVVSGSVTTSTGKPVADRRVVLVERTGPSGQPHIVATAVTGPEGNVTVRSPALTATSQLVLRVTPHVASAVQRVVVHPVLEASASRTSSGATVAIDVTGGHAGDEVTVSHHGAVVGRVTLNASGQASVSVALPGSGPKKRVVLVVRLLGTSSHAATSRRVVLAPRAS